MRVDTPELSSLLEVVSKDVEEHLRIGVGVDMSVGFSIEKDLELGGVDDVSVLIRCDECMMRADSQ